MTEKQGRLIIISAPSGTGKTTVINQLRKTHPEFEYSISCTTRPIRGKEVNGREYYFFDKKTFLEKANSGLLAEWCEVHENLYGTPKEPIDAWIAAGKDVLLDLDVVGCMKIKKFYDKKAIAIFLLPPSEEELKRRLFSRGTDSEEQKTIRLNNAHEEMKYKDKFDFAVVNDSVDRACKEIEDILGLEK